MLKVMILNLYVVVVLKNEIRYFYFVVLLLLIVFCYMIEYIIFCFTVNALFGIIIFYIIL